MSSQFTRIEKKSRYHTLEESHAFLPLQRPIYPKLTIIDDGSCLSPEKLTGEVVRIRESTLTIGRTSGGLIFPAERMMSHQHARISLDETQPGRWAWKLSDLDSRHGVFIMIAETEVRPGNELLIGGTKLGFMGAASKLPSDASSVANGIVAYEQPVPRTELAFALCSYAQSSDERLVEIERRRYDFGMAVEGEGQINGDPFLEPRHLTIRSSNGRVWKASDKNSYNGTWLRIREVTLGSECIFLVGEQRFQFKCQQA